MACIGSGYRAGIVFTFLDEVGSCGCEVLTAGEAARSTACFSVFRVTSSLCGVPFATSRLGLGMVYYSSKGFINWKRTQNFLRILCNKSVQFHRFMPPAGDIDEQPHQEFS